MRDPDRIDPFLAKFAEVWKRNPDMRFGQLFMNLIRDENNCFADPWEWEDDEFLSRMEKFPSAEQISAEASARITEALKIWEAKGPDAALEHLFGKQE